MAGFRFSLILLSTFVFAQIGLSQATPARAANAINKVYLLAELGDDPNLCKWVADTIPQMIKPGSWNGQNLCYFAPAKVLAIYQTPEVHAQVEEFLANMRKSLPHAKAGAPPMPIAQAYHSVPVQVVPELTPPPLVPLSASQAYPVPATQKAPKHLFHFIIRYEGAGIIDSNVTKFAQALTSANSASVGAVNSTDPSLQRAQATLPEPHYPKQASQYILPTGGFRMPTADQPAPLMAIPVPNDPAQTSSNVFPPLPGAGGLSR